MKVDKRHIKKIAVFLFILRAQKADIRVGSVPPKSGKVQMVGTEEESRNGKRTSRMRKSPNGRYGRRLQEPKEYLPKAEKSKR